MTKQGKMRAICFGCFALVIAYLMTGCAAEPEQQDKEDCCSEPYTNYESFVRTAVEYFEVDGFVNISEDENFYYSVSIPENAYFTESNDLYENDPVHPKYRMIFFIDVENWVLVWISYLFSEDHLKKEFVTIDEFPAEYATDQMEKIYPFLSESYECVLKENHCITLLKFYPLNQMETDDEAMAFRGKAVSFIQDYCSLLDTYYS